MTDNDGRYITAKCHAQDTAEKALLCFYMPGDDYRRKEFFRYLDKLNAVAAQLRDGGEND